MGCKNKNRKRYTIFFPIGITLDLWKKNDLDFFSSLYDELLFQFDGPYSDVFKELEIKQINHKKLLNNLVRFDNLMDNSGHWIKDLRI